MVSSIVLLIVLSVLFTKPVHADDWLSQDKKLHFAAGATISFAAQVVQNASDFNRRTRDQNALILGVGAGLAKEIYDAVCECGTASGKDFWVTAFGAVLGTWVGGHTLTWQFAF